MENRDTLATSKRYDLFVDLDDDTLWLEIIDGFIEMEFNGITYARLHLESLSKKDLLSLGKSLVKYAKGK